MIPVDTSNIYGLTLREAMRKWGDIQLRLYLRTQDAAVQAARIHVYYEKCIDAADDDIGTNARARAGLAVTEAEAILDLKARLEAGTLHVMAVPTRPVAGSDSVQIPGKWATDLEMDLDSNAIQFHDHRYVYVRVFPGPAPEARPSLAQTTSNLVAPNEAAQVAALTDEVILELLEEHARRVIASPGAKLIAPGKVSLLPIIRRKLIARGEDRSLLETKEAESKLLASWIESKVEHHHTPSAKTIAKVLSSDYWQAKARSTRAIE